MNVTQVCQIYQGISDVMQAINVSIVYRKTHTCATEQQLPYPNTSEMVSDIDCDDMRYQ